METNKKQRYLVLLVAFSMLLTFLPSFGIENVNAQSTAKDDAKYSEQKCYDGMCFEGEVEGKSLKTYQEIAKLFGPNKKPISFGENYKESHKEIYYQYQDELSKGGMWLKFTDNKYTDKNGKPRTFYVAKKPILKNISYNDIVRAGMIYGWDTVDESGNPTHQVDNTITGYRPTIVEINGEKYIVRLLRGRSNYGASITQKFGGQNYKEQDVSNSEWNRTIVAVTKQYRGQNNSMEQALKDGNSGTQYVTNNYKNQTAYYNWFGDLTLGAWESFKYNNKLVNSVDLQGQNNWVQEYSSGGRTKRGGNYIDDGAATSGYTNARDKGDSIGFRPVLEPLEGVPGEVINVTQTLNIKKTNPKGKPLEGVEFKINNDTYKTDSNGDVIIPIYKYPTGILTLKEQEYKDTNGINYKPKNIPINHVEQKCYDGMCFEGEVEGNSLVSYSKLIQDLGITSGSNPSISQNIIDKYPGAKEINNKYQDELSKGGMWLKFTDNKYKDKNGKPRTFYVAKKPIRKRISWNDIFDAGAIYGWDVVGENGKPKQSPEKYENGSKNYQGKIITINGERYIVRLLQGGSNYGDDVTNGKIYQYSRDAKNSEWNRTIVAITKQYRGESSSMEQSLKDGNISTQWVDSNYKNHTAEYNWFGDLTLGAYYKFVYNGKEIDNGDNGTGSNGQWNWTQEYAYSAGGRSLRGGSYPNYGAANSSDGSAGSRGSSYGFRPVLEPLNN